MNSASTDSIEAVADPREKGRGWALARCVVVATLVRSADGAVGAIVRLAHASDLPGWVAGLLGASITVPHLLGPFIARRLDTAQDGREVIALSALVHGVLLGAAVARDVGCGSGGATCVLDTHIVSVPGDEGIDHVVDGSDKLTDVVRFDRYEGADAELVPSQLSVGLGVHDSVRSKYSRNECGIDRIHEIDGCDDGGTIGGSETNGDATGDGSAHS